MLERLLEDKMNYWKILRRKSRKIPNWKFLRNSKYLSGGTLGVAIDRIYEQINVCIPEGSAGFTKKKNASWNPRRISCRNTINESGRIKGVRKSFRYPTKTSHRIPTEYPAESHEIILRKPGNILRKNSKETWKIRAYRNTVNVKWAYVESRLQLRRSLHAFAVIVSEGTSKGIQVRNAQKNKVRKEIIRDYLY